MDRIKYLFAKIVEGHEKLGTKLKQNLQSGLSDEKLAIFQNSYGISFDKSTQTLFSITNGTIGSSTTETYESWLLPGYYLMPVEEIVQSYRMLSKNFDWNKDWIPILSSGSNDYLCIKKCGNEQWPIVEFSPVFLQLEDSGDIKDDIEYNSLEAMLQCILEGFEKNAFVLDDGAIEENGDLFDEIVSLKLDQSKG